MLCWKNFACPRSEFAVSGQEMPRREKTGIPNKIKGVGVLQLAGTVIVNWRRIAVALALLFAGFCTQRERPSGLLRYGRRRRRSYRALGRDRRLRKRHLLFRMNPVTRRIDDRWRDKDEQVALQSSRRLAPESSPDERQVAQNGNLILDPGDVFGNEAAKHDSLAVPHNCAGDDLPQPELRKGLRRSQLAARPGANRLRDGLEDRRRGGVVSDEFLDCGNYCHLDRVAVRRNVRDDIQHRSELKLLGDDRDGGADALHGSLYLRQRNVMEARACRQSDNEGSHVHVCFP